MQPQDPEQWRQPAELNPQITYGAPVNMAPQPVQASPQPQTVQAPQPLPVQPVQVQSQVQMPQVAQAPQVSQPVMMQPQEYAEDQLQPVEEPLDAQSEGDVSPEIEDEILLRWQANEYIQHDRTSLWYVFFAIITFGLMAVAIFLIKSVTFAVLIPVMMAALFVYVRRQPASLNYTLTKKGLYVNDKLHSYDEFKAFGVVSLGGHHTAQLIPRKRFQIGQSVYFPEEVGEALVDMLAARLPMQDVKPDLYDRIIMKLKM